MHITHLWYLRLRELAGTRGELIHFHFQKFNRFDTFRFHTFLP
ncbi:hypothetical protein [uncultured Victivallis sp.]|nr:hypothetical protein [uncultured Victivallis sp.]